jgi:membrane fusion protein (multidrug efflux system)
MIAIIKRYWKLILLIAVAIFGLIFWSQKAQAQKKETTISTAKVKKGEFIQEISSSGKTKAAKSVELKFQSSGKLTWVGVKEGDTVTAYQAIASLDSREVRKSLEKALRDYSNERNDFEETWRVTYDGKKPNDAFNDTVKRILQKNQWDLEKAVLDVELKNIAVEYATLITPIGGIVSRIDTPVAGVNITPATAVFEVIDPATMLFEANIDEVDIGALTVGQLATINLDAFPEASFSGSISYISYSSQTSSGGATVFPVKIAFNAPQNLRVGLNGDVSIITNRQQNVVTIPTEALQEDKNGYFVYKKEQATYKKTPITTGARNEDEIIVTSGLDVGDVVVTKGFSSITK